MLNKMKLIFIKVLLLNWQKQTEFYYLNLIAKFNLYHLFIVLNMYLSIPVTQIIVARWNLLSVNASTNIRRKKISV